MLDNRPHAKPCCPARDTMVFRFGLLCALVLSCPALGADAPRPWWDAETALGDDGSLVVTSMPWWKRAESLAVGEHFVVTSGYPGGGQMLVRRERLTTRRGKTLEAVVWILDDDGDLGPGQADGDRDSDCYVVDYDGDGQVDRLLDYLDNDADGRADKVEIRYFHRGQLRLGWFGVDLDRDGRIWDLVGYEYSYNFFRSDPRGDGLIYANAYDPARRAWIPISECPFAFYDTDGDGYSEAVVRASAVPMDFDPSKELDPGNALFDPRRPFEGRLRRAGVVNIRYSVDLDGVSGPERPLHYDLGFNMIGRLPYRFEGMACHNPLRRSPSTTVVMPHALARRVAETYPADQTGFSWHEYGDDAVVLGHGRHAGEDRRWEGVFWTWQRRFMHNTGNPTQTWNIRREFRPTASTRRELYYCRADRRIHLRGATEGWIQVGHLGDAMTVWGEVRTFDTDGDGRFDRWETYRSSEARPAWTATVRDGGVRDLPSDWDALQKIYTREILPEALAANERLMAAMRRVNGEFRVPDDLSKALAAAGCDSERRYVQDVIRHTQYLALRDKLLARSAKLLDTVDADPKGRPDAPSTRGWELARAIAELDAAYAEGDYDEAAEMLGRLAVGD